MSDMYDITYHIYNQLANNTNNFSTVGLMEKEKILKGSVLEKSVHRYLNSGLKQVYGMSLNEYMDLNVDYMEVVLNLAEKEMKKRSEAVKNLEDELEE